MSGESGYYGKRRKWHSWGYEDGSNGTGRRGWMYFTLGDQRQAEYAAGYAAAQAIGLSLIHI